MPHLLISRWLFSNTAPDALSVRWPRPGWSGQLNQMGLTFYYLDLISYRPVSNKIVEVYQVPHESPQVLLIRNGECVYSESHSGILMDEIVAQAGI